MHCRQYWRIGNTCDLTYLDLQLVYDNVIQNFTFVARDDVALGFNGTAKTESGTHWELSPSSRFEIVITAPLIGAQKAYLWTLDRSDGLSNPARPVLQLIPDINAPTPAPVPATPINNITSMRVPTNLLAKTPAVHRIIDFAESFASDGSLVVTATPRDQPTIPFYEQTYSNINATQGTVEDWIVNNPTGTTHHFHIHQMHYILLAINEVPVPLAQQQYYDSINVEHGTNITLRIDFTGEQTFLVPVIFIMQKLRR